MITADHAMEQAHTTANLYASYAKKSYEYLFDTEIENDRQAAATFMAGFMQAASTDFIGWAIQNQIEGLREQFSADFDGLTDLLVKWDL